MGHAWDSLQTNEDGIAQIASSELHSATAAQPRIDLIRRVGAAAEVQRSTRAMQQMVASSVRAQNLRQRPTAHRQQPKRSRVDIAIGIWGESLWARRGPRKIMTSTAATAVDRSLGLSALRISQKGKAKRDEKADHQ